MFFKNASFKKETTCFYKNIKVLVSNCKLAYVIVTQIRCFPAVII